MPQGRVGADTEQGMAFGPGVLYDTSGGGLNPTGFGVPGESILAPPVPGTGAGRALDNPPGAPDVPAPSSTPRSPTAPSGTAAPRQSNTRPPRNSGRTTRQGNVLSRALRGVANRLRGTNNNN